MADITAATCRAGRGLLDMTQMELAEASGVSASAIKAFEWGKSSPGARTLAAIEAALVTRGVIFLAENGGGAGVRLRKEPAADGSTTTPPGTGPA